MEDLSPGELAAIHVTFIENRGGQAIVRLPNGSKTTLDHDALRPLGGSVHFVRSSDGRGETAWCQEPECDWSITEPTRTRAEDKYLEHLGSAHGGQHT